MSFTLDELRDKIGQVDQQILDLIAERMHLVKTVGEKKIEHNLPVKDFSVEKKVLERNLHHGSELELPQEITRAVSKLLIKYAVISQDELHSQSKKKAASQNHSIAIIGGGGQMGSFLADFFESFDHEVAIFDPHINHGNKKHTSLSKLEECLPFDYIIVSVPLDLSSSIIRKLCLLKPKGIIFDVCSLKSELIDPIQQAQKNGVRIGTIHPMFGPDEKILSNKNILFCKTADSETDQRIMALFKGTTANLVLIDLEEHDPLMAYVLGLSHMINLIFADTVKTSGFSHSKLFEVASTTFKNQYKVAAPVCAENLDLYFQIQKLNHHSEKMYKKLQSRLKEFEKLIHNSKDSKPFKNYYQTCQHFLMPSDQTGNFIP